MMPLFWVVLWSMLPPLALSCGPDCCMVHDSSSLKKTSPLLNSLHCHNDYESYVHCKWREHGNQTLQLWFEKGNHSPCRKQCAPHGAEVQHASENRTVQCRYHTRAFAIGIKHTVFFLENKTLTPCSSVPHELLDLSLHLRARPPVNLSTHEAGDGGRRLTWSSPYPSSSSSSSSSSRITYQLSYRTDRQDNWTTEEVTNTSVKLEKRLLLPGRRYEARVRARASVGQWSDWSPVVTWRTKEDSGQSPSLHCVLDGEEEVTCSWEVSREVDHFITYQLAYRHNQSERYCVDSTVTSDLGRAVLRYSCSMTVADPARLLVGLLPAHAAKSFKANKHIRPGPPQQVKVRPKDTNWMVEWTDRSTASKLRLCYQVCYYRAQDQGCSVLLNISEGSMSVSILGASLASSQHYQVKVRSLLVHKDYEGIPSEWTDPVDWTSQEAIWSPTTLIYFTIGVFVAAAFFTLYCTIPACQRRAILWVDSVPSPGKSKILSEIKSITNRTLMQSESMPICKVMRLDSMSTCSSDALLWPTKDTEQKRLEQDTGSWRCDNLPPPAEKDTSSMSFSGPYIFCQSSERRRKSAAVECEEKEREQETPSDGSPSPFPGNCPLYGEGYVCLPGRSVFRSTQDLVSHSSADAGTHRHDSAAQDTQRPDEMDAQPGLSEAAGSRRPPASTSGPFAPWPQTGPAEASGYCHLPAAFTRAAQ